MREQEQRSRVSGIVWGENDQDSDDESVASESTLSDLSSLDFSWDLDSDEEEGPDEKELDESVGQELKVRSCQFGTFFCRS